MEDSDPAQKLVNLALAFTLVSVFACCAATVIWVF